MSNRDGTDDIFVVNADGGGLRNLTRGRAHDRTRIWHGREHERSSGSRPTDQCGRRTDGRSCSEASAIARPRRSGRRAGRAVDETRSTSSTRTAAGFRRLTHNWRSDGAPVWSPDGRKILFLEVQLDDCRRPSGDVYVMNADGSGQRNLTRSVTRPFATERARRLVARRAEDPLRQQPRRQRRGLRHERRRQRATEADAAQGRGLTREQHRTPRRARHAAPGSVRECPDGAARSAASWRPASRSRTWIMKAVIPSWLPSSGSRLDR